MKTLPTDFIELTRDQGDALWWACDAWFDHCSLLINDPGTIVDRALLAASNAAGNALRSSLQTAGVDRTIGGYEGLIAAQDCVPNNDIRDRFGEDCSYLARLWETISPDPMLSTYETDYRWLVQVYESLKPP